MAQNEMIPGGFVPLSTVTATGDLIVGTAAGAVGRLAAGAAGTVIGGGSTPAYVTPPGFEVGYDQVVNNQAITGTTAGSPTTFLTSASHSFDGAAVLFQFFAGTASLPSTTGGNINIILIEDPAGANTQIGVLCYEQNDLTGGQTFISLNGYKRYTPAAGAHVYAVAGWVSATTGSPTIFAGAGTTTTTVPMFLRATKV